MDKKDVMAMLAATESGRVILEHPELVDYLLGQITQQAAAMESDLYDTLLGQLQQPVSEEATRAARMKAKEQSEKLVTRMTESQLDTIGETIAKGLEDGLGPDAIARRLDVVTGLDSGRAAQYDKFVKELESSGLTDAEIEAKAEAFYQKLLRDRKETIAATEARDATATAREIEAQQSGKRFKSWITVGDERVSQMDKDAQSQGWIPVDDTFVNGVGRPPSHPNCRCTVVYRKFPPTKEDQDRAQNRAENQ